MSHRLKLQPDQNPNSPGVSAGGPSGGEGALAALLDQACRVRRGVAAGLQVEALPRTLLEDHILTTTHMVKQLSADTQALQRQMAQLDSVASGTAKAVRSLDQKNGAVIGDLRGRVARCDASIATLSADMSGGERRAVRLQQETADLRSAEDTRLKELHATLRHDLWRLEASVAGRSQEHKISLADLHTRVRLLETRMSGDLQEAQEKTEALSRRTDQRLGSLAQSRAASSRQRRTQLQDNTLEADSRSAARLRALEARVEQLEARRDQTHRSRAERPKRSGPTAGDGETSAESSLRRELQLLKQEQHKGFLAVHAAIKSLREICDIKSRLDKEKLQRPAR